MNVGVLRCHRASWVYADDHCAGMRALALADALKNRRMALVGVGAEHKKTIGIIRIRITTRGLVFAVRLHISARCGGHAQTRIAVHIIGADPRLEQLVRGVALLGEQLPGTIEGHGVRPVVTDCFGKLRRHQTHRLVPGSVNEFSVPADFRRGESARDVREFRQHRPLDADHALVVSKFVATHVNYLAVLHPDEHAASRSAEAAHGLVPAFYRLPESYDPLKNSPTGGTGRYSTTEHSQGD